MFFRSQQPLFKAKQVLRRRCQQQLCCCSMLQPVQLSVLLPLQSFARVFAGLDKRAGDRSRNLGRTRAMAAAGKMDVLDTMEGRKALQAMAAYLGIDGTNEKQLMWIAERALMAPLPRNWEEISTPDGKTCYMHSVSKITAWQHPRDDYFKSLVVRNRERARFVEAVLRNNSMYRFDEGNCSKEVAITDDGRRATCLPSLVYPSFRLRDPFFTAVRCVQLRVESLPDLGFISFGFGPSNFHKNEDCIPEDVANYFAYTSIGETYSMGALVRKNGVRISSGDVVLMVVNFPMKRIVWYRNAHPVAWLDSFSLREAYAAFVFGAKTYSISVTECIRLPHELMRWDKAFKTPSVELVDDDFGARSCAPSGYTAVRAAHAYSDGMPYFECQVVNLAKDGYVLIGLGGPEMGECNTHIPDERFDHYGVSSSGEAYVRGLLVKEGLPRFGQGDRVGFMINFARNQVAFYLNDKPVVEFSDLPQHEDFWPSVVFGAPGYLVRINPVPRLPLGITRWNEDLLQPYRYDLMHDDFTATSLSHATCIAVAQCCVVYETGVHYSEVVVDSIEIDATVILGVALTSCGKSLQLVPDEEHLHMGLSSGGDVYVFGHKVNSGIAKLRDGDAVGILLDLTGEACTLYRNGNPVHRVEDRRIRGQFSVTLCALGRFKCSLLPTPRPPQAAPEWSASHCQEDIVVSRDRLICEIGPYSFTRSIWGSTVYSFGTKYLEFVVELHGRLGEVTLGVGNRNFFGSKAVMPYEEYFAFGYSSRGKVLNRGKIVMEGKMPFGNGDRIGFLLNFDQENFTLYKNGYPEIVGDCPGISVGVSPMVTFCSGPHEIRIIPMPVVPPPSPRWEIEYSHPNIEVSNFGLTAKNHSPDGCPCSMVSLMFEHGVNYVEFHIDYVPVNGYMSVGVAVPGAHVVNERVLPAQWHHFCFTSMGEVFACGKREAEGLEDFVSGDTMGLLVDMNVGSCTFLRNHYPVSYITGIAKKVKPIVCFGYKNYGCSINATARVPVSGVPRWDPMARNQHLELSRDYLGVTNRTWLQTPTLRATTGFTSGVHYFEVFIENVSLGGHLTIGVANRDIWKCAATYAPAEFNYFCYTSAGDVFVKGVKVKTGLQPYTKGDDIGFKCDMDSKFIIFFRNRSPVAEIVGVEGELYPAMSFGNERFSARINTGARQKLEVPHFSSLHVPDGVGLFNFDMTAVHVARKTFPAIRTNEAYQSGIFFLELTVEALDAGGFISVGVASLNIPKNRDYMPPEKFNAYSYSCTGEFFALGARVQGELETFKQGDNVGFLCDLVDRRIQFYLNGKLVGAIPNMASHIEYTPFVILGEGPFQVSINKVPTIAKLFSASKAAFEKKLLKHKA